MFFFTEKSDLLWAPSSSSSLQKASSTFPGGYDCMISRVLSPFLVYPRSHPGFFEEPASFQAPNFEPSNKNTHFSHFSPIFPVGICLQSGPGWLFSCSFQDWHQLRWHRSLRRRRPSTSSKGTGLHAHSSRLATYVSTMVEVTLLHHQDSLLL